jgi:chemotaxis protein methyltransferase CheR
VIPSTVGGGPGDLSPEVKAALVAFIVEHFGLRLSEAQAIDVTAALLPLFAASESTSPRAMLAEIAAGRRSDLLAPLVSRATNGETHFFRVSPQIEALRNVVLPDIVTRRRTERRINAWSAGCSTGEEPYTLAILLREQLLQSDDWAVELLATDINEAALATAEAASYGEWSFRDTPELIRLTYFLPAGKRWTLTEPVRRMVHFARLNLAADPFPSPGLNGPNLDLILCRNVTIYFDPAATQRLYLRFAAALVPGGWLLLGPSDPFPEQPGLFEPVQTPGAVVWRRAAAPSIELTRFPTNSTPTAEASARPATKNRPSIVPGPNQARASGSRAPSVAEARDPLSTRAELETYRLIHPLDAGVHLRLGMVYLEAGDIARAVESLRRATFLDPNNPLAHFTRSRACLRLGDRPNALAALTQARRILARLPDDQEVAGGDRLTSIELRRAVEIQLTALSSQP